jgi:hypothetical protein
MQRGQNDARGPRQPNIPQIWQNMSPGFIVDAKGGISMRENECAEQDVEDPSARGGNEPP